MFTGLIEEIGKVKKILPNATGVKLTIESPQVLRDSCVGDSIAVNGCCLTLVGKEHQQWTADVVTETMRCTALGQLKEGDLVNLETALRFNERLGGHLVQGHVDGTGTIQTKHIQPDRSLLVTVSVPLHLLRYIVDKGSVAIDGVSLTVVTVTDTFFSFALIPHTAQMTTLGQKSNGSLVNIETDMIAKYLEKLIPLTKG